MRRDAPGKAAAAGTAYADRYHVFSVVRSGISSGSTWGGPTSVRRHRWSFGYALLLPLLWITSIPCAGLRWDTGSTRQSELRILPVFERFLCSRAGPGDAGATPGSHRPVQRQVVLAVAPGRTLRIQDLRATGVGASTLDHLPPRFGLQAVANQSCLASWPGGGRPRRSARCRSSIDRATAWRFRGCTRSQTRSSWSSTPVTLRWPDEPSSMSAGLSVRGVGHFPRLMPVRLYLPAGILRLRVRDHLAHCLRRDSDDHARSQQ